MSGLNWVALGFAGAEVDHRVREVGGNNRGPRIEQYCLNADPPIRAAVAWCALFVQYVTDQACQLVGVPNPLDAVKLEAYVQSYYEWAAGNGRVIDEADVLPGDLVLFWNLSGSPDRPRYDHMGIVHHPPNSDQIMWSIEGNTSDSSVPRAQREGDVVADKPRDLAHLKACFVRWT